MGTPVVMTGDLTGFPTLSLTHFTFHRTQVVAVVAVTKAGTQVRRTPRSNSRWTTVITLLKCYRASQTRPKMFASSWIRLLEPSQAQTTVAMPRLQQRQIE